jgi:hypothetical protein
VQDPKDRNDDASRQGPRGGLLARWRVEAAAWQLVARFDGLPASVSPENLRVAEGLVTRALEAVNHGQTADTSNALVRAALAIETARAFVDQLRTEAAGRDDDAGRSSPRRPPREDAE